METTYTKIPIAPKYELGSNNVVRNIETKTAQSLKKGTKKFYLLNKEGERKLFSLEDLKASIPVQEEAPALAKHEIEEPKVKAEKKPKEKTTKEKKVKQLVTEDRIAELKEREDVKRILAEAQFKKHEKIYRLHKLDITNHEIHVLIGSSMNNVSKALWMYEKGHQKKPF